MLHGNVLLSQIENSAPLDPLLDTCVNISREEQAFGVKEKKAPKALNLCRAGIRIQYRHKNSILSSALANQFLEQLVQFSTRQEL